MATKPQLIKGEKPNPLMESFLGNPDENRPRRWGVWLALWLGLLLSGLLFAAAQARIYFEAQENFRHAANEVADHLDQELEHHLMMLDAMQRMSQARQGNWRWHDWKRMSQSLFAPSFAVGQQMILYVRRIEQQELDLWQQRMNQQGLPDWKLRIRTSQPWRDVVLFQTDDGSSGQNLMGVDLQSSSECRWAMAQSTDLAQTVISGPIRLPMHEELNGRLAIFSPVYGSNLPPSTVTQRRQEIVGWVVGLIDFSSFLQRVVQETGYPLSLSLDDQRQPSSLPVASVLLKAGRQETQQFSESQPQSYDMTQSLEHSICRHPWRLTYQAQHADYAEMPLLSWGVLAVALMMTALVTSLTWALGNQRIRARKLARRVDESHQQQQVQGQKLAILVQSSCRGIMLLDQSGRIQWVNPAMVSILKLSEVSMRGRSLVSLLQSMCRQEARVAPIQQKLVTGQEYRDELELQLPSGAMVQVVVDIHPVRENEQGSSQEFVVTCSDITVRRQADRQATQQQELQRELQDMRSGVKAMEQVLAVVSHELRTPLAGIRAITELMLTDLTPETSELDGHHQFVQQIHDSVSGMSQTITNILEAARINSGRTQWTWDTFDPAVMVDSVIQQIQLLVTGNAVGLRRVIQPNLPLIRGDAQAIQRMLLNLAANAARFTKEGWIEIRVGVVNHASHEMLEMVVEDTGQGMTQETLSKLGTPFALASGSVGSDLASGTGLGLSICRAIAAAHGGQIIFKSELGAGTCVRVLIRTDLSEPVRNDSDQQVIVTEPIGESDAELVQLATSSRPSEPSGGQQP